MCLKNTMNNIENKSKLNRTFMNNLGYYSFLNKKHHVFVLPLIP